MEGTTKKKLTGFRVINRYKQFLFGKCRLSLIVF